MAEASAPQTNFSKPTQTPKSSPPDGAFDERQQLVHDSHSDNETRERPVREQLKNTSIATPAKPSKEMTTSVVDDDDDIRSDVEITDAASGAMSPGSSKASVERGRVRRKRSFEEIHSDQPDQATNGNISKHVRKRSRETDLNGAHERSVGESYATKDSENEPMPSGSHEDATVSMQDKTSDRPVTPPDSTTVSEEATSDAIASPKNKRNREQFAEIISQETSSAGAGSEAESPRKPLDPQARPTPIAQEIDDGRQTKRHRDSDVGAEKDVVPPASMSSPSASVNAASASPFASLSGDKSSSALPQTSSTAFASSGFASLAASATSPFASLGSTTSLFGSFGSPAVKSSLETAKSGSEASPNPVTSGFGALQTSGESIFRSGPTSSFGSQSSGFGQLGASSTGGFAALGGSAAGLNNFASVTTTTAPILGLKAAKPFGAPADDNENGEDNDEDDAGEEEGKAEDHHEHKDSRFFEQEIETGEEDEITLFQSRAKLYVSSDKVWKERGLGTFKLNAKNLYAEGDDKTSKPTARFVMRADGSHRVVLNSPVKKEIRLVDPTGGPPKGKTAIFLGFIDGKGVMLQLKMRTPQQTLELYDAVQKIKEEM